MSFTSFGQEVDQISVLDVTVCKVNSIKKVDFGNSEQKVINSFGQSGSNILQNDEEQGVTIKSLIYPGMKIFLIQESNALVGFELSNSDYYFGKAGRLMIRVGDPISDLEQFIPISYQNRDINKGYLLVFISGTDGGVADSPLIVNFNSSGLITKVGLYF